MGQVKITIARQYGSGGREIGRRLAQKLSIPFYGKTELMELAKTQPDYQEAVSYTHRDVYKRQGLYLSHPGPQGMEGRGQVLYGTGRQEKKSSGSCACVQLLG